MTTLTAASAATSGSNVDWQENARPLVGLGIVVMVLGALALLVPVVSTIAIAIIVGALILVMGLAECFLAFRARSTGPALFMMALGVLGVLTGVIMLFDPLLAAASLTLVLAAYFLVHAGVQLVWAFQHRRQRGWAWAALDGVASLALAIILWVQWPVSGLWALGLLAGIKMIFTGATMVGLGTASRRRARTTRRAGPTA